MIHDHAQPEITKSQHFCFHSYSMTESEHKNEQKVFYKGRLKTNAKLFPFLITNNITNIFLPIIINTIITLDICAVVWYC